MSEKLKKSISFFVALFIILGIVITNFRTISVFGISSTQQYQAYKRVRTDVSESNVSFIYVKSIDSGEEESVYCFNLLYAFPPTQWNGVSYPKYLKEEANANRVNQLASKKILSGDELKNAILKVIYYGDSENGDNEIQRKYNLSKEQFHYVTQKAIWHFTDQGDGKDLQHGAKKAYDELIDVASKTLPANIKLNIYTTSEHSNTEHKQYQNLLSARILNNDGSTYKPKQTIAIKVQKEWEGDNNQSDRPIVKFGLFKDDKLIENSIKELSPGQNKITFDRILKEEIKHYKVYELNEKNEKVESLYTSNNKTYKVTYNYDEFERTNTIKVINKKVKDIIVTKQWLDKDEKVIINHPYKTLITAYTNNGNEAHEFDRNIPTNHYYLSINDNKIMFTEKGDKQTITLKATSDKDNGDEIIIGGKKFIATLQKVSDYEYKVINKEKADKQKTFDIYFSKVAVNGSKQLEGASLKVVEGEGNDGSLVQEWVSTKEQNKISLVPGIYTMVETKAPENYKLAKDIIFKVTKDGKVEIKNNTWVKQTNSIIKMEDELKDKPIKVHNSSKTKLKVEKQWVGIDKKDAPEITVYLVKNGIKTKEFIRLNNDNNWMDEFKNLDIKDNDKTNVYTVVEDGETDGKIILNGDKYNVNYVDGKIINAKIEKPTSINIKFSKQDIAGKELKGATIVLQSDDGLKETWTSEGKIHEFNVKEGSYTLTEMVAPEGYEIASMISFKVIYNQDKNILEVGNIDVGQGNRYIDKIFVMVDNYKKSNKQEISKKYVKTGDNSNIFIDIALFVLSIGFLIKKYRIRS